MILFEPVRTFCEYLYAVQQVCMIVAIMMSVGSS